MLLLLIFKLTLLAVMLTLTRENLFFNTYNNINSACYMLVKSLIQAFFIINTDHYYNIY